jgi:hypothetical protein
MGGYDTQRVFPARQVTPMSHNFGNNYSDGHQAKSYDYKPTWEKDVDYNPDHQPSSSRKITVERGRDILMVLQVKGLGVITLRATTSWLDKDGDLHFEGCGIFDRGEIGYAPGL